MLDRLYEDVCQAYNSSVTMTCIVKPMARTDLHLLWKGLAQFPEACCIVEFGLGQKCLVVVARLVCNKGLLRDYWSSASVTTRQAATSSKRNSAFVWMPSSTFTQRSVNGAYATSHVRHFS